MPPLRQSESLPTSGINLQNQRSKLDSTALAAVIQHNTTNEGRQVFRHPDLWPIILEGMGRKATIEFQSYVNDYVRPGQSTPRQRKDYANAQRQSRLYHAAEIDAASKIKKFFRAIVWRKRIRLCTETYRENEAERLRQLYRMVVCDLILRCLEFRREAVAAIKLKLQYN
jgi:hypothetical protein